MGWNKWEDKHTKTLPPMRLTEHLVHMFDVVETIWKRSVFDDCKWMQTCPWEDVPQSEIFFLTIDLFKSSNLDSAQVIWQNIHLPCNMSCFQTNNVIYCSISKIPRLKTKTWRIGPPCILIYCTTVMLSHLLIYYFWECEKNLYCLI